MDIPKDLKNEIFDYCRENDITNIDNFLLRLLKQGFTIEKFGSTPVTKINFIKNKGTLFSRCFG
jgi:hypothetical protein